MRDINILGSKHSFNLFRNASKESPTPVLLIHVVYDCADVCIEAEKLNNIYKRSNEKGRDARMDI